MHPTSKPKQRQSSQYAIYMQHLEDDVLYSSTTAIVYLKARGVFGQMTGEALETFLARMQIALDGKANRFPIAGDGRIRVRGRSGIRAFYGKRWKAAYPLAVVAAPQPTAVAKLDPRIAEVTYVFLADLMPLSGKSRLSATDLADFARRQGLVAKKLGNCLRVNLARVMTQADIPPTGQGGVVMAGRDWAVWAGLTWQEVLYGRFKGSYYYRYQFLIGKALPSSMQHADSLAAELTEAEMRLHGLQGSLAQARDTARASLQQFGRDRIREAATGRMPSGTRAEKPAWSAAVWRQAAGIPLPSIV